MSEDIQSQTNSPAGNKGPAVVSKGKRVAVAVIDLLIVPIILGFLAGLILLAANDFVRNTGLILVNIVWMVVRDAFFSPGRKMVGVKLISLAGGSSALTLKQAIIRNIHLVVPIVLVTGYFCEMARIFITSKDSQGSANVLLWRRVVYVVVLLIGLASIPAALSTQTGLALFAFLAPVVPAYFLFKDKAGLAEGDRLMDTFVQTRVVNA